jgi:uncharacterized lipoprotein YddW (UPF0748 family)
MRVLPILLLLLPTAPPARAISVSDRACEIRALWVDAFHEGIRTPAEANRLVAEARMARINVLFVQVRRRGDALYAKAIDPPLDDPAYDPGFDALAYIVDLAHREGIQVHAWMNATPAWQGVIPPRDPRHVFNRHGMSQSGTENWLTMNRQGRARFPAGYFLDPGHPAAAAYMTEVCLNVVRNYAVDGIHFDYIRYPETRERTPRGASVGYNPVSLHRFRLATGRKDTPEPGDEQWMAWRREQVTQLVRRIYFEAKAVNPGIQVSAATVAWGKPPIKESDFLDAVPGQKVFQDWHGWLKEGILDLVVPMNYARESDLTVRRWFDGWVRWEKSHKHGRQLAVGIGAYLNSREANLAQIARVFETESGRQIDGVCFFSYANPFASRHEALETAERRRTEAAGPAKRVLYLSSLAGSIRGVFDQPASPPGTEEILAQAPGDVPGTVLGTDGSFIDGARIPLQHTLRLHSLRSARSSDGNSYLGFSNLKTGKHEVGVEGAIPKRTELNVDQSKVPRVTF